MGEIIRKLKRTLMETTIERHYTKNNFFNFKEDARIGKNLTACPYFEWKSDTRNKFHIGARQHLACERLAQIRMKPCLSTHKKEDKKKDCA